MEVEGGESWRGGVMCGWRCIEGMWMYLLCRVRKVVRCCGAGTVVANGFLSWNCFVSVGEGYNGEDGMGWFTGMAVCVCVSICFQMDGVLLLRAERRFPKVGFRVVSPFAIYC